MMISQQNEGMTVMGSEDKTISADKKTESVGERFRALRESTGMNRTEFAEWLDIPYRTMGEWENNKRVMPKYVFSLIEYRVKNEFGLEKNVLDVFPNKGNPVETPLARDSRQSKESVLKKLKDCVKILEEDKSTQKHVKCPEKGR